MLTDKQCHAKMQPQSPTKIQTNSRDIDETNFKKKNRKNKFKM